MMNIEYAYDQTKFGGCRLSPANLISRLYEKTDENGNLFVPDVPYRYTEWDAERWMYCRMDWNEADRDRVLADYESLQSALEKLAAMRAELGDTVEENRVILEPPLLKVWKTYIRNLTDGTLEDETERAMELVARDSGTVEEMLRYWMRIDAVIEKIRKRIGEGVCEFDVMIRAKRLFYLMARNAPKYMLNREACLLAQSMVLHRYCSQASVCTLIEGWVLPLTGGTKTGFLCELLEQAYYDESVVCDPVQAEMALHEMYLSNTTEEVLREYELAMPQSDGAARAVADQLSNLREINPKRIAIESGAWDVAGYLVFPDKPSNPRERRRETDEKEAIRLLRKVAEKCGIPKNQVCHRIVAL